MLQSPHHLRELRILKKPTQEIPAEAEGDDVAENPPNIQQLMRDVMREYFPPARPRVNQLSRVQSPSRQPRYKTPRDPLRRRRNDPMPLV